MDFLRYSRQMIMPQVGSDGQKAFQSSKVLVVGAGGIGATVAMYLAGAGIPTDVLDFDKVEVSNLHRQIIHDETQAGKEKAVSAVERMRKINSQVPFNAIIARLSPDNAVNIVSNYDLVVDATDNIDARYTINDCCVLLRKPFISGSAVSMDGQITTVIPHQTPCYRCLYPSLSVTMGGCRSCADAGVLGPIPGLVGCLQAIEVMKLLLNKDKYLANGGDSDSSNTSSRLRSSQGAAAARSNGRGAAQLKPLLGRQLLYDGVCGEFHDFSLPRRRPDCAVCGDCPTIRSMSDSAAAASIAPAPVCNVPDKVAGAEVSGNIGTSMPAESFAPSTEGLSPAPQSQAQPALPAQHRISAAAFASAIRQAPVSLVLDVRSAEQFSILHLKEPHLAAYASPAECLAALSVDSSGHTCSASAVVINVPLSSLKGGKAAADRDSNQRAVLRELQQVRGLLQRAGHVSVESRQVGEGAGDELGNTAVRTYVLCRRGIDSVTATQLLLSLGWGNTHASVSAGAGAPGGEVAETSVDGFDAGSQVLWNVEGGLTAWAREVDPSLEMY